MRYLLTIGLLTLSQLAMPALGADKAKSSSYSSVTSPSGIIAHSLRFFDEDGEPEGRVFIEKDGKVIATIKGVLADSFSPTADILLVREAVADHDLRSYFLDIGAGKYTKTQPRLEYVFGSPYVTHSAWSKDGKFVVLFEHPGITEEPPAVIKVSDFLTAASE